MGQSENGSVSLNLNDEWKINKIPKEKMDLFRRKADEIFSEDDRESWSVAISNFLKVATDPDNENSDLLWHILAHGYDQDFVTFFLSDIPNDANKALSDVCEEIDSNSGEVIAGLYASAMNERLYMVRYPDTNMPHTILFQNISSKIWNSFRAAAKKLEVEPVELAASIFHIIGEGEVVFTPNPIKQTKIDVNITEDNPDEPTD